MGKYVIAMITCGPHNMHVYTYFMHVNKPGTM